MSRKVEKTKRDILGTSGFRFSEKTQEAIFKFLEEEGMIS